jgi:hypothetical protein
MTPLALVTKEITHRRFNFLLTLLAVALAAATFIVTRALLSSADRKAEQIVADYQAKTEAEMKKLEDKIRKSMKGLGFNIYIFPEGQNMSEIYEKGYASKTMPESYVTKLANSNLVTVNHLLPTLTKVIEWPEVKRKIILIGIRGEVPLSHKNPKKPLLDPVSTDSVVLGYELHNSLGYKVGDVIKLNGREFQVSECYPERGNKDDITAWINLAVCQTMFDEPERINSILALECNCATVDRLGEIRAELLKILPGTKIIEHNSIALARAEARNQAQKTAQSQLANMKENNSQLKQKREKFAAILIPFIGLICMSGIALLTFLNVRERIYEVGLLLAIGVQTSTILVVFLLKSLVCGAAGAIVGIGLAAFIIAGFKDGTFSGYAISELVAPSDFIMLLIAMPLLSALAAWLPSFWAAQQDPAEILRHE